MPTAEQFFAFINNFASKIPFAKDAVALYFCMVDEDVPLWAKLVIGAALLYLINPFDLVPDFTPFVGFGDDAAVIVVAISQISEVLNEKHYRQATEFLGW